MKTKTLDFASLDNQPDLDELLEDYAEARAGYNSSDGKPKYLEKIAQAKEAILALIEKVIGEDEPVLDAELLHTVGLDTDEGFRKCNCGAGGYENVMPKINRNELRKQQRLLLNGSKSKKGGKE